MPEQEYLLMFGKTRDEMISETKKELRAAMKSKDRRRAKELFEKLKKVFIGDDVFWANEVASNYFVVILLFALIGIQLLTLILNRTGTYKNLDGHIIIIMSIICICLMLSGCVLCFVNHGERHWLKYYLMFCVCFTVAVSYSFLGYRVEIALVIPVALSVRYFSKRFTVSIAVLSGILMVVSVIFFAYNGAGLDLNTLELAKGTVITVETNIRDAMYLQEIVTADYVRNLFLFSLLPNMLQYIVISVICIQVANWGHKTILEQADVAKEFSRVDTELNLARDIQANILPNIFPAFPDRKEIDIYASMEPAKEVGGDFYDFFLIDEDHLAMVMADVSGKGVPAALFMMIGKALIKNQATPGTKPSEILAAVNHQFCENNENGLFITAWVGILTISTGELIAANAGHEYPVIKRKDSQYELFNDGRHGFVLGGMDGVRYRDYTTMLKAGDCLFVYTDGVTEATNGDLELFGTERLVKALNHAHTLNQETVLKDLRYSIERFVGDASQFDDITMLGLRYCGAEK